jgi:hypothetical protein
MFVKKESIMDPRQEFSLLLNRRYFLQRCSLGLGAPLATTRPRPSA